MTGLIRTAALAAAMIWALGAAPGWAQAYPSKPVHIVVPYPPGGTADILTRALGQQLDGRLKQPVIVENKPGAGSAIGADLVAKAAPDGYTLLMGTVSSHAINPSVNPNVNYDPIKDFTPVAAVATIPFVLVAHPSFPAKSVRELVDLAKSSPGKINYASAGIGTSNHLAGELLRSAAHIDIVHVPYRGSAPALADVVAGHVQMMFDLSATALPHIESKTVRALAITSKARSPLAPALPTMAESGLPGFEASAWFGVFGPAGMPAEAVARLHAEINAALGTAQMRELLAKRASDALTFASPAEFAAFVQAERDRWGDVVREAKITAK